MVLVGGIIFGVLVISLIAQVVVAAIDSMSESRKGQASDPKEFDDSIGGWGPP
jgi:hypothetical protein